MITFYDFFFRFESNKELPKIFLTALPRSTNIEQIEKIQKFAKENDLKSNKDLNSALKDAEFNLKWSEKHVPIIKDYLKKAPSSAATMTISHIVFIGLILITYFN